MNQYLIHFAFFMAAALIIPFRKENTFMIGVLFLAAVSEIVQIWIPFRTFDWMDMKMNYLGLAAGWSLRALINECYPVFRKYYRRKAWRQK
jgi:glycopeptide antibiotics resistance protein